MESAILKKFFVNHLKSEFNWTFWVLLLFWAVFKTQGFMLARQVLYHLSHSTSTCLFGF
jgi:hypothetical protein